MFCKVTQNEDTRKIPKVSENNVIAQEVLSHALTFSDIGTFGTLTSVVAVLLLWCSGSLPSCTHSVGDIREDFLWGVGKLIDEQ